LIVHLRADRLIEHYPGFERTLRESLRALVGEEVEKRVEIGMAKDGSGVGGKHAPSLSVPNLRLLVLLPADILFFAAALGALQGLKSPS
jgi:hypothetical protein